MTNRRAEAIDIADRLDIYDLYARQSQAVDSSDGDGWAASYTEDGVFESPTYRLVARGREELKAFAESSNNAALERGEQFRHVISSIVLTPEADGSVSSRAYLMILATDGNGTRIDRSTVVHDRLTKADGAWLFSSRRTARDGA